MRRLQALAAAVPADAATLADVGHDHGLLLANLLRTRPELRVLGVELRRGAERDFAARFAGELPGWKNRLQLRRGDAFEALRAGEAEVVVMAGFGERAMLEAIDRGHELGRLPRRLVLGPADFEVGLRPGLLERGWRFAHECLVAEGGRFFEVLAVERRGVLPESEAERRWGPCLLRRPEPLLRDFLADVRRRQPEALRRALESRCAAAASPLLAKLALLPEVEAALGEGTVRP